MLINVDPILSPDILKTLREMGHGDRLVISDINYPAHSNHNRERLKITQSTTSNLKRSWCPQSKNLDWSSKEEDFLEEFLYQSTQVKNIWIPYGE